MPHSDEVLCFLCRLASPEALSLDVELSRIASPWRDDDSLNDEDWQRLPAYLPHICAFCSATNCLSLFVSFLTETVRFAIATHAPPEVVWGPGAFLHSLFVLFEGNPTLVESPPQPSLLYMMGNLAPLPLTSNQVEVFQIFASHLLQPSAFDPTPLYIASESILAFLCATGRLCRFHPELSALDPLVRAIPAEWFGSFLQVLTTGRTADDCALFRNLIAISAHPSCDQQVHYDVLSAFPPGIIRDCPLNFAFWPDEAINDLFEGIRALRIFPDLVRDVCDSITHAAPAILGCILMPNPTRPWIGGRYVHPSQRAREVKWWMKLITVFESRDIVWDAEITGPIRPDIPSD